MKEITYSRVPARIVGILNKVRVKGRHVETVYFDDTTKLYKIVLRQKYKMGSDPVFLSKNDVRYLYREDRFDGFGSPDRREGMILQFFDH